MIVSHKYKFIFIKNVKVASSSMEIALSKFCGPDDIITLIDNGGTDDKARKKLGYPGPQHHNGFWCHDDAEKIKKRVGNKIWNEYYNFSFIRNPWDTAISKYFWVLKGKEWDNEVFKKEILRLDINNFLQKNINRISVNGKVSMDDVFKYLQGMINAALVVLPLVDVRMIIESEKAIRSDNKLREQLEKRKELINKCPIDEVKSIRRKITGLVSITFIVNIGGLLLCLLWQYK